MDWGTLAATVSGGSIANAGTLLADHVRHRREESRDTGDRRRAASLAFLDASRTVAGAGQAMFERLRDPQRTVGGGATADSPRFHAVYHPYIGYIGAVWRYAVWRYAVRRYRVAVRAELDGKALTPQAFGWESWDGTDRCPSCRTAATSPRAGRLRGRKAGRNVGPPVRRPVTVRMKHVPIE